MIEDWPMTFLGELVAQNEVRRLKTGYMQGLDDRLRGQVADLFWEDAIWESLPARVPEGSVDEPGEPERIVGRDAIAQSFIDAADWMSFTAHFLTNEYITVEGSRATGTWKLLQTCTADSTAFWQAGVYRDDFECRDGVWKFSHLRLAMDFRTPHLEGWATTRMWQPPTAATSGVARTPEEGQA